MNFIHKQNRSFAPQLIPRPITNHANIGNTGYDTRQPHKITLGGFGNNFCQRRFAAPGRSVKNDIRETIGFNHAPQKLTLTEDMFLSHNFIQSRGAHTRGKRFCSPITHA